MHVDGVRWDVEGVAAAAHDDQAGGPEQSSQLGDEPLQAVADRRRRVLAPQRLDELIGRDHLSWVQRQHRQQGALLGARDDHGPVVVVEHLELAEQRDAHGVTVLPSRRTQHGADQVPGPACTLVLSSSSRRRMASPATVVVDGLGEEVDDTVVTPEGGEVFERQVNRPGNVTRGAQRSQLVDLSLLAGHARSVPTSR